MKKIISIGEALIDFIPDKKGCPLKDVPGFTRTVGGAPANVAAAAAKLGAPSVILTKLGLDAFGAHIIEFLNHTGVNTNYILRTGDANTSLAFVSLKEDGNRDFSFYRNPGADMLLSEQEICEDVFNDSCALHFCSVDLIEAPVKYAHKRAIEYAVKHDTIISFDPNIRLPLWEDPLNCRKAVREFLPHAQLIKLSDEELEFITGFTDIHHAKEYLFCENACAVLYSMGRRGSMLLTRDFEITVPAHAVKAVDTTGAGDSIIGAFLYKLAENGIQASTLCKLSREQACEYLQFATCYAEYSIMKRGAIASYADQKRIQEFIKQLSE